MQDYEQIINDVKKKIQETNSLHSLILQGSYVTEDFIEGYSDLDFLIVTSDEPDIKQLSSIHSSLPKNTEIWFDIYKAEEIPYKGNNNYNKSFRPVFLQTYDNEAKTIAGKRIEFQTDFPEDILQQDAGKLLEETKHYMIIYSANQSNFDDKFLAKNSIYHLFRFLRGGLTLLGEKEFKKDRLIEKFNKNIPDENISADLTFIKNSRKSYNNLSSEEYRKIFASSRDIIFSGYNKLQAILS
ncbi:nucleotidyltransferase domain-containing protein [archaeon]|nr:MAG: nucleotidyltransferase domain-containing protein [archaeon]